MRVKLLLLFIFFISWTTANADTAMIAVASNFAPTMKELEKQFNAQHKQKIKISLGSSGKLYAQILHGAPYHILLSADQKIPKQLQKAGLVQKNGRFSYAEGRLVLWGQDKSNFDNALNFLKHGEFKKVALANPKLAPYGQASIEVIDNLGLSDTTKGKILYGENINQAFQFTQTRNADIGFLALSQLKSLNAEAHLFIIPNEFYNPILQDAVLLKTAANNQTAKSFFKFLQSEPAKQIIANHGYANPSEMTISSRKVVNNKGNL